MREAPGICPGLPSFGGTGAKTFKPDPKTKRLVMAVSRIRRGKLRREGPATSVDERGEIVIYRTRRELSAEERRAVISRFQEGAFIKDLAREFEIDHRRLRKVLYDAGVARPPHRMSPQEISEAARLYEAGSSLAALGERYGVDAGTVRSKLLKAGVVMRQSSTPRSYRFGAAVRP